MKLHGEPYSLGQAERLLFLTAGRSREKSAEHATSEDLGHTELVGGACRSYFKTRGCGFSQKGEVGPQTTLDPSVFPRGLYSLDRLRFFPILPKKIVEGLGEQNREQGCETCCLGRVEGHVGLPGGLQEYHPRMSALRASQS